VDWNWKTILVVLTPQPFGLKLLPMWIPFSFHDLKVVAKSGAILPRALARGLELKNNLGVLTPQHGGVKPHPN
jgi:hypothetical protein